MRRLLFAWAICLALATVPSSAQLALVPSLGVYDVGKGETAAEAGLELRLRPQRWGIQPVAGAMVTDDAAAYGYLGGRRELPLGSRWVVTPTVAVGAYRRGDGKDLGRTLEFRSGLELARLLAGGGRVGLVYYHLSNASLADRNPGSESLALTWAVPLGRRAP
jgi:hypothetical protein